MFLCCFLLFLLIQMVNSHEIDVHYKNELNDGERLYSELVEKAQSYGDCWKRAMHDLGSGCKRLTEEIQSRLALSFSNCFLIHAGLEPRHCAHDVPISDCLKNCDHHVFSTYTEFFTHTHSICHYLQHKEWQEDSSKTVLTLIESSKLVTQKLDDTSKSQSKIIDLQQAALSEQKRLIHGGRILKAELQNSRQSARDMYKEFKTVTEEQRFLLFEVFDRLRNLQNFVLGEFTGLYTVIYHVSLMILMYILTSVPRTGGARIWLILITLLSAASERILITCTLQEHTLEVNPQGVDGILSTRIWLCRKIMFIVSLIILAMAYYCYKDYNVINNQLLKEIRQQNEELLSFMKGVNFQENMFLQHKSFSASLNNSSIYPSPILHESTNRKIVTKTGTKKSNMSIKSVKTSCQVSENKENIPLNSGDFTGNLKKTSKKQPVRLKKTNTPEISSFEESVLSELESSVSKRYNLRSSSRLNSPELSPYA